VSGKSILLISDRADDLEFATEAASVSGLPLVVMKTAAEGAKSIATGEHRFVIVDASTPEHYQKFEKELAETVGLFSEQIDTSGIHFLSSENLENVPYIVGSPVFGSFVLRNYGNARDAGQHYGRVLGSMASDRAFGLEKLLKPGTKIQTIKLQSTSQKAGAVDAIRNYLLAAKYKSRMATIVSNAVDELLMNSMFDAPVDASGRQIYASTPRSTVLALDGKASVEVQVGFDGNYIAVTAVDHFGSLDKARLLAHISKIYTEDEYKVKTTNAGAGIGLATVFRSGGSFLFSSESGSKTEVTVFFKRVDSFKEFRDQFRFIATQFYFT